MNRSVLQSSPVQQMMAGNPNNWWNMRPPPAPSPFFSTTPSNFLTSYPPVPSWHNDNEDLPESWSQLLMSGVVSEEDKARICEQVQSKKNENWEEQMKQEISVNNYVYGQGNEEFHTTAKSTNWFQTVSAASSSSSSSTKSFSSSSSMLDFSNNSTDTRPPPSSDPSSECNSVATGGALKKARVQQSTTQPTFKVRKEKLGDRITALHQLVSPFGKTDTASVLLEAIGYIRFLQSQIEALSLPYLGSGSRNMRHQQSVQVVKNCIFPEDPGQLLNENCLKKKAANEQECKEEEKKDLRSRGLCLVPVSSCTLQVGNDINGADYWAPAFGGGFR